MAEQTVETPLQRMELLIGEENLNKLQNSSVMVELVLMYAKHLPEVV